MKILVDENIPAMTVRGLREHSHDVTDIRGAASEGQSDADLWVFCQNEQRLQVFCNVSNNVISVLLP